jgi:GNAT superfamily N-acetyltransferase
MAGHALRPRLARPDDIAQLTALMAAAIAELQRPFLDPAQIAASWALMGLDRQLIEDRTYFVIEQAGALAGCGGWSRRATLYGGDHSPGRDAALLDPARDAARVRAMYTHPAYARRGVGRLILTLCEDAARAEGFGRAELVATLAGLPLYAACGYRARERFVDERGGAPVPLVRMTKPLLPVAGG